MKDKYILTKKDIVKSIVFIATIAFILGAFQLLGQWVMSLIIF